MTLLDLNRLAESLTAPQFEQLLRLRLAKAFAAAEGSLDIVMLVASPVYGKPKEMASCEWSLGHHNNQTKSEILDDAVAEHNRRIAFYRTSKLNLIEGVTSEVEILPLDDEIPV